MLRFFLLWHCRYVLAYSGFPYPITLTTWHMIFCSAVSSMLVQGGYVKPVEGMTAGTLQGLASHNQRIITASLYMIPGRCSSCSPSISRYNDVQASWNTAMEWW